MHCLPEVFEFLKLACDSLVNQTSIYTQYQAQGGVGGAGTSVAKSAPPAKGAGKGGDKAQTAATASVSMLAPSPVDERLFLTLNETLASFLDAKDLMQEACAVATKACVIESKSPAATTTTATTITAPYLRRRLCEIACQATARLALGTGTGGGGGKGGAGASPAVAIATAISNLKFDSPFLTCYSCLTLGDDWHDTPSRYNPFLSPQELFLSYNTSNPTYLVIRPLNVPLPFYRYPSIYTSAEMPMDSMASKETVQAATDRAAKLMETEIGVFLAGLDWEVMAQDVYDQVMEMRVEILTRLTRLKIMLCDTLGAQYMAERCSALAGVGMLRESSTGGGGGNSDKGEETIYQANLILLLFLLFILPLTLSFTLLPLALPFICPLPYPSPCPLPCASLCRSPCYNRSR